MTRQQRRRQKLQNPTIPGEVWIHIDRIDNKDGKVWAVQACLPDGVQVYHAVARVVIETPLVATVFTGAKGAQPRAYLFVEKARVEVYEGVARVRSEVSR